MESASVLLNINPKLRKRKMSIRPKKTWMDCIEKGIESYEAEGKQRKNTGMGSQQIATHSQKCD